MIPQPAIGSMSAVFPSGVQPKPQPLGQHEGAEMSPPRAETAPIGSMKWWASRSGKTIQGAIATVLVGFGYECHVLFEDYRAERKAAVTVAVEVVGMLKSAEEDRRLAKAEATRSLAVLENLNTTLAHMSKAMERLERIEQVLSSISEGK